MHRSIQVTLALGCVALGLTWLGCKDVSRYSTGSGRYEGAIVDGSFVRAGFPERTRLCVTFDADRIQDGPGVVSSSDGQFRREPLRPIPELWHDPLSTLTFGEGRTKNLVYVATATVDSGEKKDAIVVLSLLQSGDVEARIFRGAPPVGVDA